MKDTLKNMGYPVGRVRKIKFIFSKLLDELCDRTYE